MFSVANRSAVTPYLFTDGLPGAPFRIAGSSSHQYYRGNAFFSGHT